MLGLGNINHRAWRLPLTVAIVVGGIYFIFGDIIREKSRVIIFTDASSQNGESMSFEEIQELELSDPRVLDYVLHHNIYPPSQKPYNISTPANKNPSGYSKEIQELLWNKTTGFFIEAGANDGEFLSNSLGLERIKGWTGLLVEPNPAMVEKLMTKNRKAWFADVCLSPYRNISTINFKVTTTNSVKWQQGVGKIDMSDDIGYKYNHILKDRYIFKDLGRVKCYPLHTLLAAINVKHVDYLSLDVQGVELKILKTLPWDESLVIDHISTEYTLIPEGKAALLSFMESKGYRVYSTRGEEVFFQRVKQ